MERSEERQLRTGVATMAVGLHLYVLGNAERASSIRHKSDALLTLRLLEELVIIPQSGYIPPDLWDAYRATVKRVARLSDEVTDHPADPDEPAAGTQPTAPTE